MTLSARPLLPPLLIGLAAALAAPLGATPEAPVPAPLVVPPVVQGVVRGAPLRGDDSRAPRAQARPGATPDGGEVDATAALPALGPLLSAYDPRGFLEDRLRLTQALAELRAGLNSAVRPAPAEIDLLLDLAALHLAQRMAPEAASFLAAVPDAAAPDAPGAARPDPGQAARARALRIGLRLLVPDAGGSWGGVADAAPDRPPPTPSAGLPGAAPGGAPGTGPGSWSATGPATWPDSWPDAPLFAVLQAVATGEARGAREGLPPAIGLLDGYPAALADPLLPALFEAAIEAGAWDAAQDLAGRLQARDGAEPSAAYRYLLGRAAETGGDLVAAFDTYAAAAAGTDLWAQRARLALIDLGQATGTLPPEDARRLLSQTRALWTGGPLGLGTLRRLADLELAAGRETAALEVLAAILRLHPGTPEAAGADAQAGALIDGLYARGLAGGTPLAELLEAHRAVARDHRFRPGFDAHAEGFADLLAARGASAAASAEYAAIRARIAARLAEEATADGAASGAAGAGTAAPARAAQAAGLRAAQATGDRLRVKEAEALVAGGRLAEAEALLTPEAGGGDPALRERAERLRARIFAASGRHAAVLATRLAAPTAEDLRLRASAAFALGDWAVAQAEYERLLAALGEALPQGDRINLLLAAHRAGDAERVATLARGFPDLAEVSAALAAGLTAGTPEVLPLRGAAARARIEAAAQALRHLGTADGTGRP